MQLRVGYKHSEQNVGAIAWVLLLLVGVVLLWLCFKTGATKTTAQSSTTTSPRKREPLPNDMYFAAEHARLPPRVPVTDPFAASCLSPLRSLTPENSLAPPSRQGTLKRVDSLYSTLFAENGFTTPAENRKTKLPASDQRVSGSVHRHRGPRYERRIAEI
jgi:hypothetical protein